MSIYLLVFDRREQRLVELTEYPEQRRTEAENERFRQEEVALAADADRFEIVTLEADSLDELKRTHGSYFPETLPVAL